MTLQVLDYLKGLVMKTIMPTSARGPLAGTVMERLSEWLAAECYTAGMIPQIFRVARGLSAWMDDHDLALSALTISGLDAFDSDYGPGTPGHAIVHQRMPAMRRFFIESGYLVDTALAQKRGRPPTGKPAPLMSKVAKRELDKWGQWQHEIRGIGPGCIRHRRIWVADLVESLCSADGDINWDTCDTRMLNEFVSTRSAGFSQASRTLIVDATRSLMRWAMATGRTDHDLAGGILRARSSRATLPKGLTTPQVDALLAACTTTTVTGIRDRAVITLLWRLGLRAGETAALTLDNIDWAAGRLTVIGKGQRRLTLPLPADVGQELIAWLVMRPALAADRALFVRLRPPIRALTSAGISDIVKHRAETAGLGVVHAHRLRHTAAMNVIATGGALAEAQELLGHDNAATTRTYARTDLGSLRTLAVPFGQVP